MLLTPNKGAFVYNGKIDANYIINEFIKDRKYEKFPKHGGSGYSTSKLFKEGS